MKGSLAWLGRLAVTIIAVIAAIGVGRELWVYYMESPWTRDGRVRADVVQVAPDVSGFVTDVLVKDNQKVHRGDVLFRIDRERFALALRQADASVAGHQATLDQANADLKRYSTLTTDAVSQQKQEQVLATQLQAKAAFDAAVADRAVVIRDGETVARLDGAQMNEASIMDAIAYGAGAESTLAEAVEEARHDR